MHLRRALLLFAIVVGVAAVVASFSQTRRGERKPLSALGQGGSRTGRVSPDTQRLRFDARRRGLRKRVSIGRSAVVTVAVPRSGVAAIGGLGLTDAAEPDTPARFDVYQTEPVRLPVLFTPAGSGRRVRVGTLVVAR